MTRNGNPLWLDLTCQLAIAIDWFAFSWCFVTPSQFQIQRTSPVATCLQESAMRKCVQFITIRISETILGNSGDPEAMSHYNWKNLWYYVMIRNAVEDSVCKVEVNWGWNCALCKFGPCFEASVCNCVYIYRYIIEMIYVFFNLHLFKSTVYDLMLHILP